MSPSAAPVVLITGAARRVGAGLAKDLAASGLAVAVHYRSHGVDAAQVVETIRRGDGEAQAFHADLTVESDRRALVQNVERAFGRLDVLVNNASTFRYDTFQTMSEQGWDLHIANNLTAPVMLARAFVDRLGPNDRGLIVNVLDQKVLAPNPDFFTYTAGKLGLAGLTETLAMALAPRVRVVGVAPGLLLPSGAQTQADFQRAWIDTPLGHGPSIADVARTVRYLIDTPSITGRVITVDSGESLTRRARDVAFDDV